jgi:7-cyano-7-deazaguanine synthase
MTRTASSSLRQYKDSSYRLNGGGACETDAESSFAPGCSLPRQNKEQSPVKTLVVCSGGLDSVVLSYKIAAESTLHHLVSFDYGQRHRGELRYASLCAMRLGVEHDIVNITDVGRLLSGSALTRGLVVPDGHYAEQTMRATIVPNRNAIMLTIAFGTAVSREANAVAAAVHAGDHFIYPDCRPRFVDTFATMQRAGLDGVAQIAFETPFLHWNKADIVREGARLGVPFAETWSCYKGGGRHCGRCGTCVERREAFHLAGIDDPTVYLDSTYWQEACRTYRQVS